MVSKFGDEGGQELVDAQKLLNFCDSLLGGYGLDFSALVRVGVYAISIVDHPKELDLRRFYETLISVEDIYAFPGDLHKVLEVFVVVLVILPVDDDIIGDPDGAWALTEDLIHALLECIL